MSIEQQLRDNLSAAAKALIVPEPKSTPKLAHTAWWRSGPGVAIAGAAAALVLATPALLLWSGRDAPIETPEVTGAIGDGAVSPPTSVDTTTTPGPDRPDSVRTLGAITIADHDLALVANRVDEENPPTATIFLQATPNQEADPSDEIIVGSPQGFFWYTVNAEEGVLCEFSADAIDGGAEVTVQILVSPSIGCSDPYVFRLDSGTLTPLPGAATDASTQFVVAWQIGDEETMAALSEPEAMDQAADIPAPVDPVFSYCEGAAGSLYCTYEVDGGELVIRVASEPPFPVMEVITVPDE